MKDLFWASILYCIFLVGCASHPPGPAPQPPLPGPETMLITYHVIPGKEAELRQVLANAWTIYRQEKLVVAEPHVIVQSKESGDKTRLVEIFSWVSESAPDHAPDSVKKLFDEMQSCCEKRDGHPGIDGGPVELVVAGPAGK
jgi:hypothetical protein